LLASGAAAVHPHIASVGTRATAKTRCWRGSSRSAGRAANFKRSTKLYKLAMSYNRGLDRDKDGIACEKE